MTSSIRENFTHNPYSSNSNPTHGSLTNLSNRVSSSSPFPVIEVTRESLSGRIRYNSSNLSLTTPVQQPARSEVDNYLSLNEVMPNASEVPLIVIIQGLTDRFFQSKSNLLDVYKECKQTISKLVDLLRESQLACKYYGGINIGKTVFNDKVCLNEQIRFINSLENIEEAADSVDFTLIENIINYWSEIPYIDCGDGNDVPVEINRLKAHLKGSMNWQIKSIKGYFKSVCYHYNALNASQIIRERAVEQQRARIEAFSFPVFSQADPSMPYPYYSLESNRTHYFHN